MKVERFRALDAWRGIAAVMVSLEHLSVDNPIHKNVFIAHGPRFVDFFFVLSGFVIAHAYRERLVRGWNEIRPFLIRRIGRLWPLHVAILAALIGFELVVAIFHLGKTVGHEAFTDRYTPIEALANAALVHGLGIFDRLTWNTVSWSISVEAFAYVVFAIACATAPRALSWVCGALMLVGAALLVFVAPHGMSSTYDFGAARCVFGFMAGVLARAGWARWPVKLGTAGEVIAIAVVGVAVTFLPGDATAVLLTPIFVGAVWIFAAEDGALSALMKRAWPQSLGAWSYSIYMVHPQVDLAILLTMKLAGQVVRAADDNILTIVGSPALTTGVMVLYVAVVIGVSSLTYRFIELPGQRAFGRWAKHSAATVPA